MKPAFTAQAIPTPTTTSTPWRITADKVLMWPFAFRAFTMPRLSATGPENLDTKRKLPYHLNDKSPTSRRAASTKLRLALTRLGFAFTSPGLFFPNPRVVKTSPGLVTPIGNNRVVNVTGANPSKKLFKNSLTKASHPHSIYVIFLPKKCSPLHTTSFMTDFQAFRCEHLGFPSLHTLHVWHPRRRPMRCLVLK